MADIELHSTRADALAAHTPAQGGCGCGGHDEAEPELDVQTIPHAIRHAAIFGALGGLRPGAALVLSATHDPVPLLAQLGEREPGRFDATYLQRGPDRWRIRISRLAR